MIQLYLYIVYNIKYRNIFFTLLKESLRVPHHPSLNWRTFRYE